MAPVLAQEQGSTPILIDCRAEFDFLSGHHQLACSMPADQLFSRMHELPQKSVPLALIGDNKSLARANAFLTQKGYQISDSLPYDPETMQQLKDNKQWQLGHSDIRLWQPSQMIKHFCQLDSKHHNSNKIGLDIGCGSGRDMVYLAKHGWKMHGIDYQEEALQRSQRLAQNNHVAIQCYQQDLEKNDQPFMQLHKQDLPKKFDLITVCRYLHRPIMPAIKQLLNPGGIIIYQTFMQGCEKISSPKNPNFLLKDKELSQTFSEFKKIHNEIIYLPDGRPFSAFIAQRVT